MARRKRNAISESTIPRTIERIAIAALAAIATRGSEKSIAVVAVTIFLCLVLIEELGRRWVWHGKTVTLRDVALSSIGELRIQRARRARRDRRSGGGSRARSRRGRKAAHKVNAARR